MSSRLRIGTGTWVVALATLCGVTALSIDMSLPAQPTLVDELHVGPDVAQLERAAPPCGRETQALGRLHWPDVPCDLTYIESTAIDST